MEKFLSYPLSAIHYLLYGVLLVIFHPIQWVCIHWIGKKAHENVVNFLNWILIKAAIITGNRFRFTFESSLPENKPIIFVANHQSVYDIPPLIWYLRKFSPKFVGKKELGNGTPSITINLRNNGSVLIDRKNPEQAISDLENFAKRLQKNNHCGLIFPEGTRSRNGIPKSFKKAGLSVMIKNMPDAYIVPITINNSWKVLRYGVFPLGLGNKVTFKVHNPIPINNRDTETLIAQTEKIIKDDIIL